MKTQKQNTATPVQNWKKLLILAVVMLSILGGSNMIFAQTSGSFDYSEYFTYPDIYYNEAFTYYKYFIENPYSDYAISIVILGFEYCDNKTYTPKYLTVSIFQNYYKVTSYTVERKYYNKFINNEISYNSFLSKVIVVTEYL